MTRGRWQREYERVNQQAKIDALDDALDLGVGNVHGDRGVQDDLVNVRFDLFSCGVNTFAMTGRAEVKFGLPLTNCFGLRNQARSVFLVRSEINEH